MLFVMTKLVSAIAEPGTLFVILGLVGTLLVWKGRRLGLVLVTVALVGFGAILALPLDQWLLLPLEDRFPPPTRLPDKLAGVVLLGGAEEVELSEARGLSSFNATMETLTSFVDLARRYPGATLAFSGGTGAIAGNAISEADVVRGLFRQIGFDRPVIFEDSSRDTYENAELLKRLVKPLPDTVWVLVTSASHMPRSVAAFRAAGWPVTAWPVAYKSADSAAVQWRLPSLAGHLANLDMALHEWEGLLAYRLRGRSDELFPTP